MDAKSIAKRTMYIIIVVVFVLCGFLFAYRSGSTTKPSDEQLCYGSGDFVWKINACGNIIRKASERYEEMQKELATNSLVASGARQQIIRARDEFYANTLSGVNINF